MIIQITNVETYSPKSKKQKAHAHTGNHTTSNSKIEIHTYIRAKAPRRMENRTHEKQFRTNLQEHIKNRNLAACAADFPIIVHKYSQKAKEQNQIIEKINVRF